MGEFRLFSNQEVRESSKRRSEMQEIHQECEEVYFACKRCNGTGLKYYDVFDKSDRAWTGEFCCYCDGTGYIDWVEEIIRGKK